MLGCDIWKPWEICKKINKDIQRQRYVKKEEQCNDLLAFVDGNSVISVFLT